jgi:hypothetical protein
MDTRQLQQLVSLAQLRVWVTERYLALTPEQPWFAPQLCLGGALAWNIDEGTTRKMLHQFVDTAFDAYVEQLHENDTDPGRLNPYPKNGNGNGNGHVE